ncbi:14612_t:CDS:2 [Entrophospora sp. SA101]|nr:14612_t:CDS:2 [Entrophospora sp. SA101]
MINEGFLTCSYFKAAVDLGNKIQKPNIKIKVEGTEKNQAREVGCKSNDYKFIGGYSDFSKLVESRHKLDNVSTSSSLNIKDDVNGCEDASSNTDLLNPASHNYRHLIKSQLSLSKIINVYFDSIPYEITKEGEINAIRLENAANEFRKIQQDLSNVIEGRQRLDSQLRENEIEFQLLKEDSNIFKLIGPVLVKQDKAEAVQNVNKRLEYIRSEIKRMEKQIEDLTQKSEKKKLEAHHAVTPNYIRILHIASNKDFYGVVLLQQEDMMVPHLVLSFDQI